MPVKRIEARGQIFHLGRVRPHEVGRPLPHHDHARPHFRHLLAALADQGISLPPAPSASDRTGGIPAAGWGMSLNDEKGCCVVAEEDHNIAALTGAVNGTPTFVPDSTTGSIYDQLSPTDNGLVIEDWLLYCEKAGYFGQKLAGYLAVNPNDYSEIDRAIHYFGGCKIGVNLPASAQQQFALGQAWDDVGDTDILGGHCVGLQKYDRSTYYATTWGQLIPVTDAFLHRYCEEMWVRVSPFWFNLATGRSPSDLTLASALAALGLGPAPTPTPTPTPPWAPSRGQVLVDLGAGTVRMGPGIAARPAITPSVTIHPAIGKVDVPSNFHVA